MPGYLLLLQLEELLERECEMQVGRIMQEATRMQTRFAPSHSRFFW